MLQPFIPQIAVPAFFDSNHTGDYGTLQSAAPSVAIAVLDVGISSTNPPNVQDPGLQAFWRGVVQSYQAAGIAVLGCINTNDGVGAAPTVPTRDGSPQGPVITQDDICGRPGQPGYIDQWYILCPTLDGIFFDEGPASYRFTGDPNSTTIAQNVKSFYHAIYTCVQAKPVRPSHPNLGGNAGPTVLLNASEYNDADGWWLMQNTSASQFKACDIAILFERDWDRYLNHYSPGTWWTNYPPDRIAHTVYGCLEVNLSQAIMLSRQRGAGYIYVYDTDAATYNRLPPYWSEEVNAVRVGSTACQLSLVDALTISPTAPTTGQPVTASYAVQNTSGQILVVPSSSLEHAILTVLTSTLATPRMLPSNPANSILSSNPKFSQNKGRILSGPLTILTAPISPSTPALPQCNSPCSPPSPRLMRTCT
jgi:Spherulation-specific family 4